MLEIMNLIASTLLAAAAPAATEQVFTPATPPEKLTCRRYAEIGSLVKKKRVCHTAAEWKQIDSAAQRNLDDIRNARNGTRDGLREGAGLITNPNCPPQC